MLHRDSREAPLASLRAAALDPALSFPLPGAVLGTQRGLAPGAAFDPDRA